MEIFIITFTFYATLQIRIIKVAKFHQKEWYDHDRKKINRTK